MRKITFIFMLLSVLLVNAQIDRYIKVTATGDGDGTSWANAAGTSQIQTIIDEVALATNQGTVYFAAGTYLIDAQIQIKNNVQMMGGYASDGSGTRDLWKNETIFDGQFNKRILFTGDQSPHVAFDKITKVDGFILQRGSSSYGSAVAMSVGTVLENCIIRNNNGSTYGAAVFIKRHATLANPTNGWNFGGALINCVIVNNTSSNFAAGVFVNQDTHFSIINCVIANNKSTDATNGVGGLYWGRYVRYSRLTNNVFYNNTSLVAGSSNFFTQEASEVQPGIYNNYFSDVTFPDTDITTGNGNKNATEIANPGFAGATSFDGYSAANHDLIAAADWRLHNSSALIGLGSTLSGRADIPFPYKATRFAGVDRAFTTVTTDVMGSARVINTNLEMGAYEYNPVVVTTATADPAKGSVSTGATVSKGSSVSITATPETGFLFVAWNDGSSDVSTEASYSFVPESDATLTASFTADLGTLVEQHRNSNIILEGNTILFAPECRVLIFDTTGRKVAESINGNPVTLNRAGIYFIRITEKNGEIESLKVMIK
jgi:hypothetical protein